MLVLFTPRLHKHKFLVAHREMRMQPWLNLKEGFNVLLATLWLVVLLMWFNQNRKNGTNNFWCLLNILSKNMEGESPDDADLEFPNIMDLLEDIDDTEQQEAKKKEKQTKELVVC